MVILKVFATLLDVFMIFGFLSYSEPENKKVFQAELLLCFVFLINAILIWI